MEFEIGVAREGQRRQAVLLDGDAEFFRKLADQRGFRPLARFELAAGELPEACQGLAFRALRDEDAVVGIDQGAGDDEKQLHRGTQLPERMTWTGSVSLPVSVTLS